MKHRSRNATRFALTGVALAASCLWGAQAWALGLGRLNVQSALGEALRAEIEVTNITPEEVASLRLRIAPPEAYRAAGVEYNPVLPSAQVVLQQRPDGRQRFHRPGVDLCGGVQKLGVGIHGSRSSGTSAGAGMEDPDEKSSTLPYDGIIRIRL